MFKDNGQSAALDIAYAPNATDVQSQVLQLKEKKPDVVIMIAYTSDAILFAKTMQALDYKPPMMIADDSGYSDPSFIKAVGKISQGAFNRSSWSVGPPGSPTALIAEMYKKKSGDEMDDTAARQMQAFFVLCDAIDRAGSTDPAKIQAALKATDLKPDQLMIGYKGVKFDEKGQNVLAAGVIIQLQDGENYVAVWPKANAEKAAGHALQGLVRNRGGGAIAPALLFCGIAIFQAFNPQDLDPGMSIILVQVIVGGLLLGAVYALFSSGLTLVWGMMNIVNFAHGDFVMLGMYVAFVVYTLLGAGPLLGAPLAALVLATLGVIVYFGLIREHHEGADAGPDPRHLRARAVAALFGVLVVRRQFPVAAGKYRRRHLRIFGLRIQASRLSGRRGRAGGDARPASVC